MCVFILNIGIKPCLEEVLWPSFSHFGFVENVVFKEICKTKVVKLLFTAFHLVFKFIALFQ